MFFVIVLSAVLNQSAFARLIIVPLDFFLEMLSSLHGFGLNLTLDCHYRH